MKSVNLPETSMAGLDSRRVCAAMVISLGLASGIPHPAAVAQECSVDAYGKTAYARVRQKVDERFGTKDQFEMEPYEKAEIVVQGDCTIVLHGRFSFRVKNQTRRKVYDVEMTPKENAPGGMKILSYEISDG